MNRRNDVVVYTHPNREELLLEVVYKILKTEYTEKKEPIIVTGSTNIR